MSFEAFFKTIFQYPYATTEKKTVENCAFFGFRVNMPSKLPRHLTASEIFLYVLKAQKLDVKSFKIWLSLLLIESSITLLQDAFWWWFLHKYKLYPDWLSQAIYIIFQEACPDSSQLFNDAFKAELVITMYKWMTGLEPKKSPWTRWNLGALEENTIHGNIKRMSGIQKEILSKDMEFDLDKLIQFSQNVLLPTRDQETNLMPKESHNIGHDPEFSRDLFRVAGQSPLVAYYLKVHDIAINPRLPRSCKIQITQIFRWPYPSEFCFICFVFHIRKIFYI
ncbi:protein FAM227B [Phascolarctos cinereus]